MRMELGLSQQQTLKQIQTLSPQMYMSMEILCLNSLDLEQRIGTELENNETLEREEPEPETLDSAAGADAGTNLAAVKDGAAGEERWETGEATAGVDSFDARFERWDQFSREEYALNRGSFRNRGDKDEKYEALSNTEGRPVSLQEHLEQQIHLLGDDEVSAAALRGLERHESSGPGGPAVTGARRGDGRNGGAPPGNGRPGGRVGTSDLAVTGEDGGEVVKQSSGASNGLTLEQVNRVREYATEIIYNIDGRGYLMYSVEEIRDSLKEKPDLTVLQMAVSVVQSLDPPGVGGHDLRECLLLQLERDPQDYPLEERIIRDHLGDLGHNRLPKIARALGVSIEDVKEGAENVASLNPLPGKLYSSELPRYVKPDVTVEEIEGQYEVRVESDYLPRLRISSHYRTLFKESRKNPEIKKYLKKKIDSAEWLLAAIRQRQSTLQRIARELVAIQKGFLDHGISRLKPLKMADVAERLGVHVSTISRAISGKYMQTPRGIYAMKFFFTGGAVKSDGEVEARGSVIQRIKDLIAVEDKKKPLSDISIVRKLEESGIKISRRTVTKYREAERIPSSRERRSY